MVSPIESGMLRFATGCVGVAVCLLSLVPRISAVEASAAVLVVNQPKCGTGYLVSLVTEALKQQHPATKKRCVNFGARTNHVIHYSCRNNHTMVIRSHKPDAAARGLKKLRLQPGRCKVVSATRDPRTSVASAFFEHNRLSCAAARRRSVR